MTQPGPLTQLMGNPFVVFAIVGLTGYFGYEWLSEGGSFLPALIAGAAMMKSFRASDRVEKHRPWKREWDAMSPVSKASPVATSEMSFGRKVFAGVVWVGSAASLSQLSNEPAGGLIVAWFWVGSAIFAVVALMRMNMRKAAPSASKDRPVTVTLQRPMNSPHVRDAYEKLPEFCRRLR